MRIGAILAIGLAICFLLVLAFIFVALVGLVGFMGSLVTGLFVLVIAYTVELEDGSAIGSSWTPDLYASQRQERSTKPEERAAHHAERAQRLAWLSVAKHAGAALVTIGAIGFFFFQL